MTHRHATFEHAAAALARGEAGAAARTCTDLMRVDERNVRARHLHGRCLAALGRLEEAAGEFQRAVAIDPKYFPAAADFGVALAALGQHQRAAETLAKALVQDSAPAELHFALGQSLLALGHLQSAAESFQAAIVRRPDFPDAFNNLGVTFDRAGLLPKAIQCFEHSLSIQPKLVRAHTNLADALRRAGRTQDAVRALRRAQTFIPDDPDLLSELAENLIDSGGWQEAETLARSAVTIAPQNARANAALGMALLGANALENARESLQRALALDPRLAYVAVNLGEAYIRLNRPQLAEDTYRRALAINAHLPEAWIGLAGALEQRGYIEQAASAIQDAANRFPTDTRVHHAFGTLLHRRGRLADALTHYEQALANDPCHVRSLLDRGHSLESLGRLVEAEASFALVLDITPGCAEALAGLASCAFRMCDWRRIDSTLASLESIPDGIDALHPFLLLAAGTSTVRQAHAFERRGRGIGARTSREPLRAFSHDRLRVAYVSPDFREHPVAHAIVAVIERHDRSRIRPIGISLNAADNTAIGRRVRSAFEVVIEAASLSDDEVVAQMRSHEVDIAVDLAGFTVGARTGIFASRCAPVQVNYLGFPASMGAPFIDYIIADDVVIPPEDESFYAERVVRLPHCYLPMDCRNSIAARPDRVDVGLPPEGFVFCAFNNSYKIARAVFDVWMGLLADVPGSVLWLRSMNREAAGNLVAGASRYGISPGRLIFAPYVDSRDRHFARLQNADLFLDTLPYNAHTTATDALWAGLPVITCRGDAFAGRVGASVLCSANLPDLVCDNLDDYRRMALHLATTPAALTDVRNRLSAARATAPVFDTGLYVRNLEALYETLRR